MSEPNDDLDEEAWCAEQRATVVEYISAQEITHGDIGEWPAWHVAPIVAIWAVESGAKPGWVGWWAISGDLPTDYTTCGSERHPRQGLRDIATRWQEAAALWSEGKQADDWGIGSSENERTLAPLLAGRAKVLLAWADDDSM